MIELLIDGYNVIFQCGLTGRSAGSDKLERARLRLLNELAARLNEQERNRTTVVFDAKNRPVKLVPQSLRHRGLHVQFAVDYPDADSMIEELIRTHSAPKKLTVISSDHRIQTAASRRKARSLDSDVWWDQLESKTSSTEKPLPAATNRDLKTPNAGTDAATQAMLDSLSDTEIEAILKTETPVTDVPSRLEKANDDTTRTGDAQEKTDLDDFDPFPPGYADDLFDD